MPERYIHQIMRLLTRRDYVPLRKQSLAKILHIPEEHDELFTKALNHLEKDGKIKTGSKKLISLPDLPKRVTGILQMTSKGYGFVIPESKYAQGDVYIPFGNNLDAMSGDKVVARVFKDGKRNGEVKYSGQIVSVVDRKTSALTGTLKKEGKIWYIQPDGSKNKDKITVDDPGAKNAKVGDKVVVEIVNFATPDYYAHGVITKKLGKSGNADAELKSVMHAFDLPDKFKRKTMNDTQRVIHEFNELESDCPADREDIRSQTIITIDPVDARDFDDAISLKKYADGHWLLGVHIADVSTFVQEGSPLDLEAKDRATSVYLPGHVIPMLPEQLSNGICSLQEDRNRFVKSAYIKLDEQGNVLDTRFANSLISSTKRLTYEDAEDILNGKTKGFESKVVNLIKKMEELAKAIQKRRQKAGMISLELPRPELVYNEKDKVVDVQPESTSFPHTMIEMFMLEANEATARLFDSLNIPFIRRIHPQPDALSTTESSRIAKECGYIIPKDINRQGMQDLLNSVKGTPESFAINMAILKSLQRAEYSPVQIGHFALASENYCHFTSPIRRYPDLTIHRLLQSYLEGKLESKNPATYPDFETLSDMGQHCSERERNAESAEDELRSFKILQLLSKHIGDEFDSIVVSKTSFGMFVQIEKFLFEGMVRIEDLPKLPKARKSKSNRHSRSKISPGERRKQDIPYKIGDQVRVRIVNVNLAARELDLIALD